MKTRTSLVAGLGCAFALSMGSLAARAESSHGVFVVSTTVQDACSIEVSSSQGQARTACTNGQEATVRSGSTFARAAGGGAALVRITRTTAARSRGSHGPDIEIVTLSF